MSEASHKHRQELKEAFRELFPLARENDLPWAACQIKEFLRAKVDQAIHDGVHGFSSEIAKVLLDVTHPKTYVVDMARNVVDELKELRRFRDSVLADTKVNLDRMGHEGYTVKPKDLAAFLERWRDEAVNTMRR